jgi:hypothetical protein
MIRLKVVLPVLAGLLAMTLPSLAAEKIWGSYQNKIDGHRVSLSVQPTAAGEKSGKAIVIFDLVENTGKDLEIDGAGTVKGQTVVLYSRRYRLTVTVNKGKADYLVEESCGNHRFYEGYGYYSDTCYLDNFDTVAKLSKGLTRK